MSLEQDETKCLNQQEREELEMLRRWNYNHEGLTAYDRGYAQGYKDAEASAAGHINALLKLAGGHTHGKP